MTGLWSFSSILPRLDSIEYQKFSGLSHLFEEYIRGLEP